MRNRFTQFLKVRSCVNDLLCAIVAIATYRLIADFILLQGQYFVKKKTVPKKELTNDANCRDRTGDLILTMDALCLLS